MSTTVACHRILKPAIEVYGKLSANSNDAFWTIPALSETDKLRAAESRYVVVQRCPDKAAYGLNRGLYTEPEWIPDRWFDTPEEAALYCYMVEDRTE